MVTLFNPSQRRTLAAIADTFIATLTDEEIQQLVSASPGVQATADQSIIDAYSKACASALGVPEAVEATLARHAPPDVLREVGLLLTAMGSRIGMLVLTGNFSAFDNLARPEREAALIGMMSSRFEAKRKVFVALKGLIGLHALGFSRGEPLWRALGYPGPGGAEVAAAAAKAAGRDEYIFHMINNTISSDTTMAFDVVVVGSGCGGSVVAAELASVGHRVLVVEKGSYYQRSEISGVEGEAFDKLYEGGGLLTTEDTGVAVLAGATFGGGSTVNWACSLRTPEKVRREWAVDYGLKSFAPGSATFDASLDAVCGRLGVTTEGIAHNRNNQLLLDSCEALGYDITVTGQNMDDVTADAPGAHFIACGDRYGIKRSTPETYLRDAATAKTPALFADRCFTERVVHEKGRVVGIDARVVGADGVTEYRLHVAAPVVVVACGAIHSPALLLRSNLPNRHGQIGKNLRLHPVMGVTAIMPDDAKDVAIWNGAPMTTVSNVCEAGRDGDGYGAKLECPDLHVGIASGLTPFFGSRSFKQRLLQLQKAFVTIVLTRDKGSGEVRRDAQGSPRLYYPFEKHDRESLTDGLEKCLRIASAAGACQLTTGQVEFGSETEGRINLPPVGSPKREAAVEAAIKRMRGLGFPKYGGSLFSAHQMGTCRMGTDMRSSVVKETGENWEVKGLYVADASTFPTSSGANPMITTMSIAHQIAQGLKITLTRSRTDGAVVPSRL
jgi:choline dehydrogenase-like flavoprotein